MLVRHVLICRERGLRMDRRQAVSRWTLACFLLGLAAKPASPLDYRRRMQEALKKLDDQVGKRARKRSAAQPRTAPPKSAAETPQETPSTVAGTREYVCRLTGDPVKLDAVQDHLVFQDTPELGRAGRDEVQGNASVAGAGSPANPPKDFRHSGDGLLVHGELEGDAAQALQGGEVGGQIVLGDVPDEYRASVPVREGPLVIDLQRIGGRHRETQR